MNKYKRLLTNTIVFAIGTFASKLLVLLLTPLYTKILSPEQYSIADLVMQTANLLIPVFTVSIANAVMRFGMDKHEDKAAVFTTGFTTISIGFAALLLCSPALLLLKDGVDSYIPVILMYVLASGMHSLCLQFVRSQGHVKLFAFDGILNTLLTIGFNILFLVGLNMHVTGYLMSTVLADALCTLFLFTVCRLWNYLRFRQLNRTLTQGMLKYSIPLIPTTILWWITNVSDRYMVKYMLGDFENGLYVVAYKIPTILVLVSMVFADAWQMSAVSEDRATRSDFFGKVFYSFQSIVFIGASVLIMLSKTAMHLLTYNNPAYAEGWRYMPILITATAFNCIVTFQSTVYICEKKSVNSMWTSLVGAVLNIALNALLIPRLGVNGATAATFISYFTIFWLRYFNTRRFIPFNTHLPRVCFNTAVLGVQCAVMLLEVKHWLLIEIALAAVITAFNFKPLIISIRRLFKRDGLSVKKAAVSAATEIEAEIGAAPECGEALALESELNMPQEEKQPEADDKSGKDDKTMDRPNESNASSGAGRYKKSLELYKKRKNNTNGKK